LEEEERAMAEIIYKELSYAIVGAAVAAHAAQARNYLAATGFRLAILCNFGEKSLHYERVVL
jgi:hypothetical protein